MYASGHGQVDAVHLLLAAGADANNVCSHGWTALLASSFNDHVEIMKVLIAHGADVNARDSSGNTPLIRASAFGHLGALRTLLAVDGIDVNAVNKEGKNARQCLLGAIGKKRGDMDGLLEAAGATGEAPP